ncbi:hypothetical protein ACGFJ5_10145 [Micromonospora echinaurantiaca]|uniref:hypothetical protein n=1 Tax=Micromonospora echinaurantiaca TaxID=47857 RepID=UPI00371B0BC0
MHETETELRLEVSELTELLREDSDFADLRNLLAAHGLHESEVLLAGLIGGEDNSQYGVFITAGPQSLLFGIGPSNQLVRWEQIQDVDALAKDFPAVSVGIAMRRAGELA